MENYGEIPIYSALGLVGGFGTAGNDFLAGSLLDQASLNVNTNLRALFSTLRASSAETLLSSKLDHLRSEEAFSANQNFSEAEALSNRFQNLLFGKATGPIPVLLDNPRSSTTTFNNRISQDPLTGSSENSPLVGSFGSDFLADRTPAKNQTAASLPDLSGEFGKVKLPPRTLIPGAKGKVRLIINNQGDQRARGPLKINLMASTDSILDANDQVLSSLERPRFTLSPNLSKTYTLDFTNPEGVAPGAYYLLANIDVDEAIAESNENNNLVSTRVSARGTDAVLDWNATLLNAIATDKTAPPLAARNMATVHTGIYAAVYVIDQLRNDYNDYIDAIAPEGVSRKAAVAAAAHRTLVDLYPAQTPTFDTQLALSLAEIADGQFESNGVTLGQFVADLILAWRDNDGSSDAVSYTPGTEPGDWQPTPPGFAPALLPQWSNVTPFAITSGSQFRPKGPPALDSAEYAVEFNQVKQLGNLNSTTRTAEQTEIAQFWADGVGTFTPPGHWNLIAERVALAQRNTLPENARLFALLNIAEADAGIASWDAKYEYNFWRPVTAIQQADTDGNPNTAAEPNWTPLLVTPPFPEYTSGHSTFSGAADAVLTSFFGDISFTTTSVGLPGVIRSFDSFTEAANEAGISRIYGGIHFHSANEDGLALGRALGNYVTKNFLV
jgi:hypothetical protein